MTRNKKILVTLITIAVLGAVGFLVYIKSTENIKNIKLPENDFDAVYQIPDTNIFFKYPSAGFYGLGINITTSTRVRGLISGIHTESVVEFEKDAQSAYVILDINLKENEKNFANIDTFAENFKKDPDISFYDQAYAKKNGYLVDVNSRKWFIYKATEDATGWSAHTINKEGVVSVRLAYTSYPAPYSEAVYENNDKLFLEILENINFIETPIFLNDEPETVIGAILQSLNDSSFSIEFLGPSDNPSWSSQWWISDDGWSIIDTNGVSIISSASTFREKGRSPVNPLNPPAKELNNAISEIFLENGFELNAANTSKSEAENEFYDYIIAFQKGETRCTLKTSGDYGEYTVACSDRFQEAYVEQIHYLNVLGNRNAVISSKERMGDFLWLNVHLRRTGFMALMRDDGERTELIFTGQESPPCDLMFENQVPEEVYDGVCYDASGNMVMELPENSFDSEYRIPDTGISFKYPSAGFYGLGIDIAPDDTKLQNMERMGGIRAGTTAEFDSDKQSAYVTLKINLIKNEDNFTSIADFSEDFKKDPGINFFDQGYAKENGRLTDVNDKKYFIFKVTEDATRWHAFAISKEGIINVRMTYTSSPAPRSAYIYKNNDELFLKILENINFE